MGCLASWRINFLFAIHGIYAIRSAIGNKLVVVECFCGNTFCMRRYNDLIFGNSDAVALDARGQQRFIGELAVK